MQILRCNSNCSHNEARHVATLIVIASKIAHWMCVSSLTYKSTELRCYPPSSSPDIKISQCAIKNIIIDVKFTASFARQPGFTLLLFYQGESAHYYGFSPDVCIRDENQKKDIFRRAAVILSRNAFELAMCTHCSRGKYSF